MRKLLSTRYNASAYNTGLLILRLGAGILMANHGYTKLENYNGMKVKFMEFMGLSPSITLALLIFAELVCAILIVLGLFTRFACIPLIISCTYAVWKSHNWDVFATGELAALFLVVFTTLLFTGPGKASIDNMISK